MDALLDTSVLIDLLRRHSPAVQWFSQHPNAFWGICPATWAEVIVGAPDKKARDRAAAFLKQFTMIYFTQSDMIWAMQQVHDYRLSHNVGILDSFIAAPGYRLQLPLYTRNLKHFAPLLGKLAQEPY